MGLTELIANKDLIKCFLYDAKMDEDYVNQLCGKQVTYHNAVAASLKNASLVFNYKSERHGYLANIVAKNGSVMWGLLTRLSDEDYNILKRVEGLGNDLLVIPNVNVVAEDTSIDNVVTFMLTRGEPGTPSREYLNHILYAAGIYEFSEEYVDELSMTKTID